MPGRGAAGAEAGRPGDVVVGAGTVGAGVAEAPGVGSTAPAGAASPEPASRQAAKSVAPTRLRR
ncbi:hypothetical protein VUN84_12470 [Micrococcaceae bacterium Sec5.8]